jgi:thiol peroxidase
MAKITLGGNPVTTIGELPQIGQQAIAFTLVQNDLSRIGLENFNGSKLVLNIFPSLETSVCAASIRRFNKEASGLKNTKVLCISRDLPFTQAKFCGAEGLDNVITLSDFETGAFGKNYGLEMTDGKFQGLHARVVIILDETGKVKYTQLVSEIGQEPDYEDVLKNL